MRRLFDKVAQLGGDAGFMAFQNEVVRDVYDSLGQGFAANENEVSLVTRMVESVNGKSHDSLHLSATKIHGSRSYVQFNFRDKPTTKELGDMAVLSVVTAGRTRLFQRLCIIQNKKAQDDKWKIDPEQLFLLKNFPPFIGNRGIFQGLHHVAFRNTSNCLGAFGLLFFPGEMVFASAHLVTELLRERRTLSQADISVPTPASAHSWQSGIPTPRLPWRPSPPEQLVFMSEELAHCFSYTLWLGPGSSFLGNTTYSRDVCDFIRAWTQLNVGEITCAQGVVVNEEVDAFANFLARSAGIGQGIDFPANNRYVERSFEGEMAVFMMHLDVERKG